MASVGPSAIGVIVPPGGSERTFQRVHKTQEAPDG